MMGWLKHFIVPAMGALLSIQCASGEAMIKLCEGGTSEYAIFLNESASASEQHAAEEFQQHFRKCTDIELPIKQSTDVADAPMIIIGFGELTDRLDVKSPAEQLGKQGCLIKTVGRHLVIAGTKEVGTLYGVHRFLEDILNVRWYAPGVTQTPKTDCVSVSPTDRIIKPVFEYRDTTYAWPGADKEFFCHVGENEGKNVGTEPLGLQYFNDGICHTYFSFISPTEFFESHPEYFSEIGGVRVSEQTQLCLTNPDVLEIVTERMLEKMKERPYAHQHNFSQMDYYNVCQCDRCKAMNEKYGTLGGTQFWFVNQLAQRTAKVYPDKLIGTLAYEYTEEAPKGMTMHPNVVIWLCHMFPSCDSHPIATCPLNADFKRRAIEWSKICSHMYIWHYITDFMHYYNPFPNFRAMAADLRFYRDIGVEGLFLQGMGHEGGGGEFSLLRPWYAMKLAWDPDQDPDLLIKDFLKGYYGPADQYLWEYITLLHDKVEKENIHMHLYTNPGQGYLPDPLLDQAEQLFDKAQAAVADDPTLADRVEVARMPIQYAGLFPRHGQVIENQKLIFLGNKGKLLDAVKFLKQMNQHGFQNIREFGNNLESLLMLTQLINSQSDVVTLQNEQIAVDIVPVLAGRILRIMHKPTGRCLTSWNVTQRLTYPFTGGIDDKVGPLFSLAGSLEPMQVMNADETSVTLGGQLLNDYQFQRTITLNGDSPSFQIESAVINNSQKIRQTRLRNHLILNMGDLRQTQIEFTDRNGQSQNVGIDTVIANLREGVHLYNQDCPNGCLRFKGDKGLELIQSFDNEKADFAWLTAYPESNNELELELWYNRVKLQSGETLSATQTIEIKPTP